MGKMKNKEIEDTQYKSILGPTNDRFDFEQEVLKFGNILEDLKSINRGINGINNRQVDHIINYYEDRYNHMWNMFEDLVHQGVIK